jgi:hypothetical protein
VILRRSTRLVVAFAVAVLGAVALPLAAPAQGTTSVCHYTGDPQEPYAALDATPAQLEVHLEHDLDVIPAPALGCPAFEPEPDPTETPAPTPTATPAPVTICHVGIGGRYETLVLAPGDIETHATHDLDLIPAPASGCPSAVEDEGEIEQEDPGDPGGGGSGGDSGGVADNTLTSTPAAAQAVPGATGELPDGLPVTGTRPDVIVLLGLAFVLSGFGVRLLVAPGAARVTRGR